MELLRVELANWPYDRGAGGRIHPYSEQRPDYLTWWNVTAVHARFEAPREVIDEYDPFLGMVVPRVVRVFSLRAYLLDLDGSREGLDVRKRVLLCQRPSPRSPWWFLREVTEKELAEMEQYRQT
ncbi:hypothetical protein [Nonomuraea basaltis]|uniref:hypothetical protein n=1 Tax=Nonomuraea basaltis TaxID=2495887 RepID=UPI00110C5F45|nr:hypothetical protein [Nonomuraea basaltis]TMR92566.1 hypothetical protein EJK15_43980 [Nonomuraea basaltis]